MSKSARIKNTRPQGGKNLKNAKKKNALTQREIPWGGIAFFTVIGLIAVVAIGYTFMQTRSSSAETSIAGLVVEKDLGRDHTTGTVKYETDPPMGGDHNPVWQNCDGRVYDAPLRNENAVHSLEHGAVWITYRPGLAADQLDALKNKVTGTDYTMLSPYPSQDAAIKLTAWGHQLTPDSASDARVDEFLRGFVKGPQTPEPGAACSGAKDTP
ncbi:DUF3105 domain-containing protein [Actinomadura bangladeshensis]|uniref:DUF3105 domain-containing protein n=1 Tax=Actinomadura bangladeshensis TaxID=453573 RepID=A0A6L9QQN1_9ACTN|nr:DUF3105 domain-containing protein [Actinomadura bangladeshensis]NEA26264.1 DUF3105 domain-containing protein [Actinomadura bangladeshensis]